MLSPKLFLEELSPSARESYSAVGLHPYAFKIKDGAYEGAPRESHEVTLLANKVMSNVEKGREALRDVKEPHIPIWITEIGWPVAEGDANHPSIDCTKFDCQNIQAELIKQTFDDVKAASKEDGIEKIFYFNDTDPGFPGWEYHCGLRASFHGKIRKAALAFEKQAGVKEWPKPAITKTLKGSARPRALQLAAGINPEGMDTKYWFEYGKTTAYGYSTGPADAGEGEQEQEFGGQATESVAPNTTYHYRVVTENENGELESGLDEEVKTPLTNTETFATARTLNGESGWVTVLGHVFGEHTMNNVYVNINLWKKEGGEFVFKSEKSTHAEVINNYYVVEKLEVGKGEWLVVVVFPGFGEDERSESQEHIFKIENGYQLVAEHSNKCLDVSEKSMVNGAAALQWECGDPATRQNQVFTAVPSPNSPGDYELVARHSNKCLDVTGASQGTGTAVQQYECLGWNQTNQVWHAIPVQEETETWYGLGVGEEGTKYVRLVAKHSGQCLEVQNSGTGNGVSVVQNPCGPLASQIWIVKSVESNQVPLEAHITVDEELNGHPGYVTGHGNIDAGGYNLSGKWVNVNFQRLEPNGKYETVEDRTIHPTLSASGYYSFTYRALGPGEWQTRVVFPGEGPLEEDKSEYHPIHIGDGYRFKFRQSGKCVSTSENRTGNGTPIIQWDCSGSPSAGDGQVYSIVPVQPYGSSEFTIRPDTNTGMCLDVSGANTANGTNLQLWECLGESQANQIWHIVPIANQPPWFASIARHSGKCMDVLGQSLNNGASIDQWECWWGGNQQWQWQSIG